MADIFGRAPLNIKFPYTADRAMLQWGSNIVGATNITIDYGQGVTRRHSIGSQDAIIYTTRPQGSILMNRLIIDGSFSFSEAGWTACNPATINLTLRGGCGNEAGNDVSFTVTGAVVTRYNVTLESEGLTVVDSVTIDFMQLSKS